MELRDVYSVKEVADYLKVSRDQVRKMIANGELKACKVGREYRVRLEHLAEFLDAC